MNDTSNIPLPDVHQAELDDARLDAFVTDILMLATVEEVRIKGGAEAYADSAQMKLKPAIERLRRNEIRGVQIIYRWKNERWMDTLLQGPKHIRIVRMQVQN